MQTKRAEILRPARSRFGAVRVRDHDAVNFAIAATIASLLIAIGRLAFGWSWKTIVLIMFAGAALGAFSFVRQHLKDRRRLRELAFEDWMDRVSAIARQHDLVVMDPEQEKIWFRRFVGGLTPDQAVRQERDVAELARYPGIGDEQ